MKSVPTLAILFLLVSLPFAGIVYAAGGVVNSPTGTAPGSQPDPLTDFIKEGRWAPLEQAQAPMVNKSKKENGLK
jgi:hypothetical protein